MQVSSSGVGTTLLRHAGAELFCRSSFHLKSSTKARLIQEWFHGPEGPCFHRTSMRVRALTEGSAEQLLPNRRAVSLFEANGFTFTREFGQALQEAKTAVPAQHSVVVSLWPDLFCLLKAFHRLLEAGVERLR